MQPFAVHTGRAVPLRRANVDTDQIIPARYLKRVGRTGFADGLFAAWRADGDFVLDRPEFRGATILLAGPDFGTGSSREHAVWALQEHGFRVVLAARFGDIFRGNAGKNGLLAAALDDELVVALQDAVERAPDTRLTVDLHRCELRGPLGVVPFDVDASTRARLLVGVDDVAATLAHEGDIAAFEAGRPRWLPVTRTTQ